VTAALSLDEAARTLWDAAVVGAGPAGSLAARQLALSGLHVLLIDRAAFPRWKVCGCCLSATALTTLRAVGLPDLVDRCGGVPLEHVCLATGPRSALIHLPGGRSLSRESLDAALVAEARRAGAAFLPETVARALPGMAPGNCSLLLRQHDHEGVARARVLLAADGLGGRVLADAPGCAPVIDHGGRIGAGTIAPHAPAFFTPGTIWMVCGGGGYAGLVRLEDGRLDIAAALDPALIRRQGGPAGAVSSLLASTGWPPVPDLGSLSWRGTPSLTRQAGRLGGPGYFVLGDAAGYVEPFTGEGMAWALLSAVAVAPLAIEAVRCWHPDLVRLWAGRHRRLLGPRRRLCGLVARVLRHPTLVRALVQLLARAPFLAVPLVRRLNSP
jgi:flavin-dependent dehydrogenase